MRERKSEREMYVAGLVLDPNTNAPIVVLKDTESNTCLPIWIGLAEATAIHSALKKVDIQRPMTHDLLRDVIEQLGGRTVKIVIHSLRENTFLASIEIAMGDSLHIIDARPSDSIALAVRTNSPIFVANDVLSQAQVTLVAVTPPGSEDIEFKQADEDSAEGKGTNFATIEKEKWAEILDKMDPDDFKYKM